MILAGHIITGAAIGANFSNPWLVILAGVAGHHLSDLLPHWDYKIKEIPFAKSFLKIAADTLAGIVLTAAILMFFQNWEIPKTPAELFSAKNLNLILGIFFSLVPDGLLLSSWFFPKKPLVYYAVLHSKLHTSLKLEFKKGILPFLIYIVIIGFLFNS